MSVIKTDSEITELILSSFQKELGDSRPGWLARLLFRSPPMPDAVGYVQQFQGIDEIGSMTGMVQGVWRITYNTIEKLPSDFSIPWPDLSSNLYGYKYFTFTLPGASKLGFVSWQSGPRCGLGYYYKVDNNSVKMAKALWIS